VDSKKNRVFKAVHPSPLSANRGWWGSRPFSTTNALLKELGKDPIDWRVENVKLEASIDGKEIREVLNG
jgi:uracil-DNA glycosylase